MKISIIGSGYVGLVTAACLADVGHEVLCMDTSESKIDGLKKGIIPIYEPGLDELVKFNTLAGRLSFSTNHAEAVKFGELIFIAVGTPPNEDGSADLQYVLSVAESIGRSLGVDGKIIVDKSTVPVGTAEKVQERILSVLRQRGVNYQFHVCSNPEFLKEGAAIEDFTKASRIIVGTDAEHVRQKMKECYAPYSRNHDKIVFMETRAAELTKYAANAMLATRISFMNEIAALAEKFGVDIEQVRLGIGSDPRIGFHFIYPGCGYGGSCFPKDVRALLNMARENEMSSLLIQAVDVVNENQKRVLFRKVEAVFKGQLKGKNIAVWGLAFKPNTDDMREAPSRVLIDALLEKGAVIKAYDPEARNEALKIYGERLDLQLVDTRDAAVKDADALIVCTEWKEFRTVDFNWLKAEMRNPIVIDGRNIFNPEDLKKAQISYYGIGRGDLLALERIDSETR